MLRLSEGKELAQFVEREQIRSLGLQRYTKKPKAQNFRLKKKVSCLPNALDLTEEKHQKHAYTQRNRSFFGTFR